jgi:hypothetical protein
MSNSMTTVTAVSSGIIPVGTDAYIYDINSGEQVLLPAYSILVEISIRRVNHTDNNVNDSLTPNRSVIVGIPGDPTVYSGVYGVPTNDLNTDGWFAAILDKPVMELNRIPKTVSTPIIIRSGLLGDIVNGEILVSFKYRQFPTNRPIIGNGGNGILRHLLS